MKPSLLHLLLSVLLLLVSEHSMAAAGENDHPLSEPVHQSLTSAREMLDRKEYRQAESTLNSSLQQDINPYERALVQQMLGYVYHALDQRGPAITAFSQALADNLLPENVTHDLHYILAQLLAQDEKYREALDHLTSWFKDEKNPQAEAHLLAGTLHYQLQDYASVITHMEEAIGKADKPEQNWYELLLAGYYHTENYTRAARLLEQMISRYPDRKDLWLQLAGMYQKANLDGKALAAMELALKRGLLDETGILQLARLHLNEKLPQRAAVLLQEQMDAGAIPRNRDNLELLAESWQWARENDKAAAAFTELAALTNDPAAYYRLGYLYFTQEKWEAAGKALATAVKNGALKDKPDAWLLLGISAYHNHETATAAKALNQALSHDSTRQQAQWWLDKLGNRSDQDSG
ncbi:MAG: tetratricopeptide repeat protein [Gammaproteobacteria bacterium]